jgi:hypothetical protein
MSEQNYIFFQEILSVLKFDSVLHLNLKFLLL